MKYQTCNCTLPDYNPEACKSCQAWQQNQITDQGIPFSPFNPPYQPETPWIPTNPGTVVIQQQPTKRIKRITRTIERYDELGNYKGKEVITEDHEDVDVPDYKYGWTITTAETGNANIAGTQYNAGVSTDAVTLKKDTPFTYTAGNTGDRHVDSVLNGMNVISGQVVSNIANSACYVNATKFYN